MSLDDRRSLPSVSLHPLDRDRRVVDVEVEFGGRELTGMDMARNLTSVSAKPVALIQTQPHTGGQQQLNVGGAVDLVRPPQWPGRGR